MPEIKQFSYAKDNLGYIVFHNDRAAAIDGGAADEMISWLAQNDLILECVVNTHSHPDHTVGNQALMKRTGAQFIGFDALMAKRVLWIGGEKIDVIHTPGHSADSVCFHFDDILVSGDTLLYGKVGRCFTGDHGGFLQSVKTLLELPETTTIYAGHDYVTEYMEFVRNLEPDNPYIDAYLKRYDPNNLHYSMAEEIRVNPYLRFNDPKIASILKEKGMPAETEFDRWQSLLSIM